MCLKLVSWSKPVGNAVIPPSHWSYTVQKQVIGGWDRDTILPITQCFTINMIMKLLLLVEKKLQN